MAWMVKATPPENTPAKTISVIEANTIDKVLTFGQSNPNEDIHYVGASVIYSWQ